MPLISTTSGIFQVAMNTYNTYYNEPWLQWCTTSTTSTTIWTNWITSGTNAQAHTSALNQYASQTEAHRQRWEHQRASLAEETRKRDEAEARAESLLLENLSLKQREDFRQHRHFTVHGRNHRYRVRRGRMGNVDVIDARGIITERLCCHPGVSVPDCDTMLAQKLMLECEEDVFWRTANRHPPRNENERVLEPA